MSFKPGESGNPAGRPKIDRSKVVLVREAWEKLTAKKPWLVQEALERGLTSGRPLGFLELGARVMKEIGQQEDQKTTVTIVLNSPLNTKALRPVTLTELPPAPQAHPELPEAPTDVEVLELLESEDGQ